MVRAGLILLLCTLLPPAQAQLQATLDRGSVFLGEPIVLRLSARDVDLTDIDLTPLMRDFEVFARAASRSEAGGRVRTTLDLTLYPLRSGALEVPPLSLARLHSPPLTAEVAPARPDAPPVEITAWVSRERPMLREPVRLYLRIRDDGTQQWQRPRLTPAAGFHIGTLDERHREVEDAGRRLAEHEYRWSFLPLKTGTLNASFGMIEAFRFGERLRFPAPTLSLQAQPAPAFLPASVPIGRPRVEAGALPGELILGRPVQWVWRIEAPGLGAEALAAWLGLDAKRGGSLRFYPAQVALQPDGLWQVTLAFVAERAGSVVVPTFALPYFDAAEHRLDHVRVEGQTLPVRDPTAERVNRIGLIALAGLLLAWLGWLAQPWVARWHAKRTWLAQLADADSAAKLVRTLRAAGPGPQPSLRRWAAGLGIDGNEVDGLERLRFGPGEDGHALAALRARWVGRARALPLRAFT